MRLFGYSRLAMALTIILYSGPTFCQMRPGVAPGFFPSDVADFIGKQFIEGVSPESVSKLDKSSLTYLLGAIERVEFEPYHSRIVSALGIIGDASARVSLVRYIEVPKGEITPDRFKAMLASPLALGRLAAQGDSESLDYLLAHSAAENWSDLKWISREAGDLRGIFLARAVLNGLGVSGRPEALRRLEELQKTNNKLIQESVEDNIRLNRRVASEGLNSVDRSPVRKFSCSLIKSKENDRSMGSRCLSAEPVKAKVVQSLTIIRHIAVPVNRKDLDKALEEASGLLQSYDRETDYPCPVEFHVNKAGPINFFGEFKDGDRFIQSESQLLRVLCHPGARVKLVDGISGYNLCETKGEGTFVGCAEEPGDNIIMEPTTLGDIWAHEFGHNKGLSHRSDSVFVVMHPTAPGTDEVNATECACLQKDGHIGNSTPAKNVQHGSAAKHRGVRRGTDSNKPPL